MVPEEALNKFVSMNLGENDRQQVNLNLVD